MIISKVKELKKSDDPEYQDVKELKEQIKIMRKELEQQIEEEGDDTESEETDQSTKSVEKPILLVSAPEAKKEESMEETEKEPVIDKAQYEKMKFDVSKIFHTSKNVFYLNMYLIQRTVRRLLAEGQATSYEKAELAAQLVSFNFDEYDSVQAAEGCSSIYSALQFLQQECELCAGRFPMGKVLFCYQ